MKLLIYFTFAYNVQIAKTRRQGIDEEQYVNILSHQDA